MSERLKELIEKYQNSSVIITFGEEIELQKLIEIYQREQKIKDLLDD